MNNGTWEDCGSQLLWIDAICINQANTAERNHQVNLMRSVYAQASIVLVWLGEVDPQTASHTAVEFITAANRRLDDPVVAMRELSDAALWSSLRALFNRQYWKRLWIVQETILAPDLIFFCGKDLFRLTNLATLFWSLGAVSLESGH
jgi:hypothetical protein